MKGRGFSKTVRDAGKTYVAELREVDEPRLWEAVDALVYDDGEGPLAAWIEHQQGGPDRRHRAERQDHQPSARRPWHAHPRHQRHVPRRLGDFLLVWRPATGSGRVLGPGASGPEVGWLRESLGAAMDTGFPSAVPTIFDEELSEAVRSFQRSRRLQPDGVAGARTMISLNTALGLPARPHLRRGG